MIAYFDNGLEFTYISRQTGYGCFSSCNIVYICMIETVFKWYGLDVAMVHVGILWDN